MRRDSFREKITVLQLMNEEILDSMADDRIEQEIVHCEDVERTMKDAIAKIDFWLDQTPATLTTDKRKAENTGEERLSSSLYELKSHLEKSLISTTHRSSSPVHHSSAGSAPHSEVNLAEESLSSNNTILSGD